MSLGRCNDCGGASHPFTVYEWTAARPLVRDAVCPIHDTPLAQTTRGKRGKLVKLGGVGPGFGLHKRTKADRAWFERLVDYHAKGGASLPWGRT